MAYLDDRFLSEDLEDAPDPADSWLADFLGINAFMRDLTRLEVDPNPEVAYGRYREWLPFAYRNRTFYEALARDFCYELDELEGGPGELIF